MAPVRGARFAYLRLPRGAPITQCGWHSVPDCARHLGKVRKMCERPAIGLSWVDDFEPELANRIETLKTWDQPKPKSHDTWKPPNLKLLLRLMPRHAAMAGLQRLVGLVLQRAAKAVQLYAPHTNSHFLSQKRQQVGTISQSKANKFSPRCPRTPYTRQTCTRSGSDPVN